MEKHKSVAIYTQVYNAEDYLRKCIESVLSQSYPHFQYILVDNGSKDRSLEIMKEYAEKDGRIKVVHFQENGRMRWLQVVNSHQEEGDYIANLDADDWWELEYLEQLIGFLEKNNLDLAVTGTIQHIEASHTDIIMRKLQQPVILTQKQFANEYPALWTFPSTTWATVMKMNIIREVAASNEAHINYPYGADTLTMLNYIKRCSLIGIDNSALYHYRTHPKGVSYRYAPRRFDGNIALYEQIKGFLDLHHTFDPPKQEWLKRVHLNSMSATLEVLRNARISAEEKLAECARIAEHPLTDLALTNHFGERERWYAVMWEIIFECMDSGNLSNVDGLRTVLKKLAPRCCAAVQAGNIGLFAREPSLRAALRRDDRKELAGLLLNLISQKKYTKQYHLGGTLNSLIPNGTPLREIEDTRFFRKYSEICTLILNEDYFMALEQMTGILFKDKKIYAPEPFLNLYISLAALENQIPAFIFGKFQTAWLYLRQGRRDDCRTAVSELIEMGVDNDELDALRSKMDEMGTNQ